MTFKLILIITFLASLLPSNLVAAAAPSLIITEVQTGLYGGIGGDQPQAEFIELTNSSTAAITLDNNWHLDYLSAANGGSSSPTSSLVSVAGLIPAGGHILATYNGYLPDLLDLSFGVGSKSTTGLLAKTGGHIRLMNGDNMVDCIAWGSAVDITGCQKLAGSTPNGASMQRLLQNDQTYGPVSYQAPPSPLGNDGFLSAADQAADESDNHATDSASTGCSQAIINELLANPAGDDSGREFIELHNPTSNNLSLQGCGLQVGSKSYSFSVDDNLLAGQYVAFYSAQTGLVLTNGGGSLQLLGSAQGPINYPQLADDQVWALVGGNWQLSNVPSPGQANIATDLAVDSVTGTKLANLTACPAGKHRNPETGRCINIAVPGVTKPCTVDQVRSPQTGRCKNISVPSGVAKACPTGQVRNLDTKRCRKTVTTTPKLKLQDKTAARKTKPSYLIMIAVGSLIVFYGLYEYRRDLVYWVKVFKQRLFGKEANQ